MRIAHFSAVIAFALTPISLGAFEIESQKFYESTYNEVVLRIISTADIDVFEPIILEFQRIHPTIDVEYVIASSTELMKAIYEEDAVFDLAISSAMDLQTKLANDGYARTYVSDTTRALPSWAKWRDQIFAFTQEPAVMVISDKYFTDSPPPTTREELITLLRNEPDRFTGRVGTYDIRRSGAGYLFATQDSRNTDSYWRLTEVMGRLDAKLYSSSADMISDVADGHLALAYNVVGSYAASRLGSTPGIRIVPFVDFLSVMLRTVLIPKTAANPVQSGLMIDFLAELNSRPYLTELTNLPPINRDELEANSAARPIRLGPELLVFLDRLKKETFVRSWVSSIEQE